MTPSPFDYEPDLSRAQTPPAEVYTGPRFFERELDRVFARSWQLAARAEQLAKPGAFACLQLGSEPVVIVRDDRRIRGFYNVCRHRGGAVAAGCGRRQSLQCRYHGWTYRLDGSLRRAPEMEGVAGFDPAEHGLVPIEVATTGPVIWAAADPVVPLAELLAGIELPADLRFALRREYEVDCNWKVYVDNYLEGYHIPMVHPELHRELDYDRYRTELRGWWSRQHAPLRDNASVYRPDNQDGDAEYYWIFPNTMLNIYQGQVQTNRVDPLGPDRCRVVFEWYAADPPGDPMTDPTWRELIAMSDLVQEQDAAICAEVQRNLRSRAYRPGRYSVRRENGVHHFHGLLHRLLSS